jgi:hypothetical protein
LKGNNKDLILLVDKAAATWTHWLSDSKIGMKYTNTTNEIAIVLYHEAIIIVGQYIIGTKPWALPNRIAISANDMAEQLWY